MTSEANGGKTEATKDRKAQLADLYDEYYDKIAHYAYVRIGDRTQAEDIASEVFLKALDSIKKYQERGLPMQAWLFKIAHNLVVDHLRGMTQREAISIDTIEIRDESDPEVAMERKMELERVTEAMKKLSEKQREVLRLRFFGGLTSKEVGNLLDKSDGAVREMQRAALEKLRELMAED
ncbi:MAG TPA: sigma-70 family RNA polymerase sigma factor [Dehalococcoidia bacterium]|nr:sigma-70 family RNA polymerase sigma factor [Dehalococcoidia bacterium]